MILLPPGVWLIVFSFWSYNDLIEASAVCKLFYELSRKSSGYVEKLLPSRQHLINSRIMFTGYGDVRLSLCCQFFHYLMQYVREEDFFFDAKNIIMGRLIYSILPFSVWNQMFYCMRSEYCLGMCLYKDLCF